MLLQSTCKILIVNMYFPLFQIMLELKKVASLKTICIKRYVSYLIRLSSWILLEIEKNPRNLYSLCRKTINELSKALESYVPWNLHDELADEFLKAIDNLITSETYNVTADYWCRPWVTENISKTDVAISLSEIVFSSKLKRADVSLWPTKISIVFYENLSKMVNLKALNFAYNFTKWKAFYCETKLLKGFQSMKNLRSVCLQVSCNDTIINAISEACLHIQFLDVAHSRYVTDLSVNYLLKCQHLEALQIYQTSITIPEYAKLISKLPNLRDFGTCDNFELIAKFLDKRSYSNIKKLIILDVRTNDLKCLLDFFPNVEKLTMYLNSRTTDLTGIHKMNCLQELLLGSTSRCLRSFYQFFQTASQQLTHLHLEFCQRMPVDFLVVIGNYCRLESLVICECDFVSDDPSIQTQLSRQAFSSLEKIIWNVRNSVRLLELVLSMSVNIRCFQIGRSTFIRHENLENILRANPMKFLKGLMVLYAIDMNMETVQLLLDSCPRLKVISGLETWGEIFEYELTAFRDFITRNNVDLDVTTFWIAPRCCGFQDNLFNHYS